MGAVPGPALPAVDHGPGALLDGRRPHVRRRDSPARLGRRHRVGLRSRGRGSVRRHGVPASGGRCAAPSSPTVRTPGCAGPATSSRLSGCCSSGVSPSSSSRPSSGGPTRATGPRARWPGGWASPSRGRCAAGSPSAASAATPGWGRCCATTPVSRGRPGWRRRCWTAAAYACGRGGPTTPTGSWRPATTSGLRPGSAGCRSPTRARTPRPTSRTGPRCSPAVRRSAGRWPTRRPTS